mmetsp:Transcript_6036/g.24465  ORF Transcript_6036/g.24465 Transcript_6036/m.24465 type:complete len:283 (-) Transcript_6036:568-1416(-)
MCSRSAPRLIPPSARRTKLVMYRCENTAMTIWQSMRSVIPPCPGMVSLKSLILNARLNPLAKKPPNGAITDANAASTTECFWNGDMWNTIPSAPKSKKKNEPAIVVKRSTKPLGSVHPNAASTDDATIDKSTARGAKTPSASHASSAAFPRSGPPVKLSADALGHVSHRNRWSHAAANGATVMVTAAPPKNPSHVFFGESFINGVRPQIIPTRYAATSLKKTIPTGNTNQIRPSRTFPTKQLLCTITAAMIMCVQPNCPNWYRYRPLRSDRTKRTHPRVHPR